MSESEDEATHCSLEDFVKNSSDQDRYAFLKVLADPVQAFPSGKGAYLPGVRKAWDRYFFKASRLTHGSDGKSMVAIELDPSSPSQRLKNWYTSSAHVHKHFAQAREEYAAEHKGSQHTSQVDDNEAADAAIGEPYALRSPARKRPNGENEHDDPDIATADDRCLGSPRKRTAKRRSRDKGKAAPVKQAEPRTAKSQNAPRGGAARPPPADRRPPFAALANTAQPAQARLRTGPQAVSSAQADRRPGAVSNSRGNPAVDLQALQFGHIDICQYQTAQGSGSSDDPPVDSGPRVASLSASTGDAPLEPSTMGPPVRHSDVNKLRYAQTQHGRKRSRTGSLVNRGPNPPPSNVKTLDEVRAPGPMLDATPWRKPAAGSDTGATLPGATSAAEDTYTLVSPRLEARHMEEFSTMHLRYPYSRGHCYYVCPGCTVEL